MYLFGRKGHEKRRWGWGDRKRDRERERRRKEKDLHCLVRFSVDCSSQVWVRQSQKLVTPTPVFHKGAGAQVRGSSDAVFPGTLAGQLSLDLALWHEVLASHAAACSVPWHQFLWCHFFKYISHVMFNMWIDNLCFPPSNLISNICKSVFLYLYCL